MCSETMVCHGDVTRTRAKYTPEQLDKIPKDDCTLATYYITNDGKYAIHSDFVDVNNLDKIDLDAVPKIELK